MIKWIKNINPNLVGIAGCFLFIAAEVNFDLNDTPEHPLNQVTYWLLPMSIMLFTVMFFAWRTTNNIYYKSIWWFLFALSGNWMCRFIFGHPNVYIESEYIWAAIFALGIPIQIYKHFKK